ncbi:MAG: hypothetical protein JOY71_15390 [Acetobacteraceae bacterium]|nr:hypothetical protein [Acetobacteraceae bacterium]MBV8523483.1 hypothetical protein [Acetobacteraceae bacterium]
MAEVRRLYPHDPLPDDRVPHMLVLRRFAEDGPAMTRTEISTIRGPGRVETSLGLYPDGREMDFESAVALAKNLAESAGISAVFAVDRTEGPREREILEHHGDHTVNIENLDDVDVEDGELGPDMRDSRP